MTPTTLLVLASVLLAAAPDARHAAVPVDHRPLAVDRRLDDVTLTTRDGSTVQLGAFVDDAAAVVIVVRDADCPLCKKYGPRLAQIETDYAAREVRFLYLNLATANDAAAITRDATTYGFAGPYIPPAHAKTLGAALGVRTTTEVFVIDRARTLVYRGAVDDQHGIGFSKPDVTRAYLREALDAAIAAHPVRVKATSSPGCVLEMPAAATADAPVTYHERVSRILDANCGACHRADGPAPFLLDSYDAAKGRARMIRFVVEDGLMPPWFAAPVEGIEWGNDMSLSDADRRDLLAWIDAGCPEGDPAAAPVTLVRAPGWLIGEPDVVISIEHPIAVPAEGVMDYEYVWVKTDFPVDRWITEMEFRPTHPEVVHHALVFLEEPRREGESNREYRRRWRGGVRGYFGGLVPGQAWTKYPDGMGKKLPAGAWLKFQIHYTPNGTAVEDQMELGLVFADEPPPIAVRTSSVAESEFIIPPGAPKHPIAARIRFRNPATLISFAPHMHLRGSAFKYELDLPDGTTRTLLDIPAYDFDWQLRYKLREPIDVPAGAVLRATGWFDNSADNPANPDPSRAVPFGEQTSDEMMIGYFEWYRRK